MERIFKRKIYDAYDYLVYTKDLRKDGSVLLVPFFMTMCL